VLTQHLAKLQHPPEFNVVPRSFFGVGWKPSFAKIFLVQWLRHLANPPKGRVRFVGHSAVGEGKIGFFTLPQGGSLRRNDEAGRAKSLFWLPTVMHVLGSVAAVLAVVIGTSPDDCAILRP
jgi:hypothetical protein